jgi:hypothetical protein
VPRGEAHAINHGLRVDWDHIQVVKLLCEVWEGMVGETACHGTYLRELGRGV